MDFAMSATTKGLGPFQPVVMISGVEYAYPGKFTTEDAALKVAVAAIERVKAFAPLSVQVSGFEIKKDK
jgi:hypothetical protein